MSNFRKKNQNQKSTQPTGNQLRILHLSQKINNLDLHNQQISEKGIKKLETKLQELDDDLNDFIDNFNNQCFDLQHTFKKISKELQKDYRTADQQAKATIIRCEQNCTELTETHIKDQKQSNCKLLRFMNQKYMQTRDLIQRQNKECQNLGYQIEQKLTSNLANLKVKLQQDESYQKSIINQIHEEISETSKKIKALRFEKIQIHQDNKIQLDRKITDIVTRMNQKISQNHISRQKSQESILLLIEKLHDKVLPNT